VPMTVFPRVNAFPHIEGMVGDELITLDRAFKFHLDVGRTRIEERIRELANHLKAGLSALPRVRLITPEGPELSSGIVCFELRGIEPGQVVETLRREHRIGGSVTPYFKQYVRFGPTIVNTPEQVDAAIEAIATLR
jgi:selenocysteine lyase/cysteine desulfurase